MMSFAALLLLFLLVAAGIVSVLVLTVFAKRGPPQPPGCGQCGYAVQGLTTLTCPECGSDLREVGIVARQKKPQAKVVLAVVAGLLLTCVGGIVLVVILRLLAW